MRELELIVSPAEDGLTAGELLKGRGFSRRVVVALKASGGLTRNGEILRTVDRVRAGELVRAALFEEGGLVPNPDVCASVAYEDEDAVVFQKPPFVAVHPSIKHYGDTLGNLFAAMYGDIPFRPINRLDRNTSGLCLCAKNKLAAGLLSGCAEKTYFAVVDGEITKGGRIDAPIERESESIIKRCVRPDGKPAVTLYEPISYSRGRTLLRVTLLTGRTHQIRVHFAHIGYPLCGDDMYGGDCSVINRHALHCGELRFVSPESGETIIVKSELPEDMRRLLD